MEGHRSSLNTSDALELKKYILASAGPLADEVSEHRELEFKASLPGKNHESCREFLADASSFSNAAGGVLLFGVSEEAGVAVNICGVDSLDIDAEMQRLEALLRSSIEPRLPSYSSAVVLLSSGKHVLALFVPRSWIPPHAVNHRGHWRFYSRNSTGKYPLDVQEVKSLVLAGTVAAGQLRQFRVERLARIVAGETPVNLAGTARVVLHVVPLGSFASGATIGPLALSEYREDFWPLNYGVWAVMEQKTGLRSSECLSDPPL